MADLPPEVRRALDRAADGPGRTATTAHPDCVCVDPADPIGRVSPTRASTCPQHGPGPATRPEDRP